MRFEIDALPRAVRLRRRAASPRCRRRRRDASRPRGACTPGSSTRSKRRDYDVFGGRARVPTWRKAYVVGRSALGSIVNAALVAIVAIALPAGDGAGRRTDDVAARRASAAVAPAATARPRCRSSSRRATRRHTPPPARLAARPRSAAAGGDRGRRLLRRRHRRRSPVAHGATVVTAAPLRRLAGQAVGLPGRGRARPGTHLLFLDADTELAARRPRGAPRRRRRGGLVSVQPHHRDRARLRAAVGVLQRRSR